MRFSADVLRAVLEEHLPAATTGLVVGVSGGADSACLLTALAQALTSAREGARSAAAERSRLGSLHVRALHIDHGLQAAAAALQAASAALCRHLLIPLESLSISIDTAAGRSIEAEARSARYAAFAHALAPGECLLTAHHAQDQAETLLLQLLRGAGVKGLSAMPVRRPLGSGWHLRPLLEVARSDLRAFGAAHGVAAAEDPMNEDRRFDRCYLRLEVWPAIARRWPGAAAALSRSAQHLAQAQVSLDGAAARALDKLRDGDALSVPGLRALALREQLQVLRHWLAEAGVVPPSAARLTEALRQILTAQVDHLPAVVWGEHALRRYQERLFLTAAQPPLLREAQQWHTRDPAPLELGAGLGTLRWVAQSGGLDAGRLPEVLSVRRRRGGETLKAAPRARTHTVQHLCQSIGVLPWLREALPMIYAGDALIAVGDLWQDARFCAAHGAPGLACVWEGGPHLT
jgi:tRNA(Ile)-lysidine synthase